MTFVDFTKAFDTVSLNEHWKIIAKFVCPPRFIVMVRQVMMTHRHVFGMMESTLNWARTLFSLVFSAVVDLGFYRDVWVLIDWFASY